MTVTVPSGPVLARIGNVELMHTGTWAISTGEATFTTEDLRSAVAAQGCPAVRRPILKLGHVDPRFDGQPAIGYVDNMATAEGDHTLVGDYAGIPSWLKDVMGSAYPDRSIEGQYDYCCALGHTHPFVVTGVALLGVTEPGIGTLESLQDVARLFGVAAAAEERGRPVVIEASGGAMPTSSAVKASVTVEDVQRAFYETPAGSDWDVWIEEMQLDPPQLIYVDDDLGRFRVPFTTDGGDGEDAVTFAAPVAVVIRYEDVPAGVAASAAANVTVRYASRAESRPGALPPTAAAAVVDPAPSTEGVQPMAFHDDLRQSLGLSDDATEVDIKAALADLIQKATPPPADAKAAAPKLPDGVVTIDADQLRKLEVNAAAGVAARDQQQREHRERLVSAAVGEGRIPPARRQAWVDLLAADPGSAEVLASLAPTINIDTALGHTPEMESKPAELGWFNAAQKGA